MPAWCCGSFIVWLTSCTVFSYYLLRYWLLYAHVASVLCVIVAVSFCFACVFSFFSLSLFAIHRDVSCCTLDAWDWAHTVTWTSACCVGFTILHRYLWCWAAVGVARVFLFYLFLIFDFWIVIVMYVISPCFSVNYYYHAHTFYSLNNIINSVLCLCKCFYFWLGQDMIAGEIAIIYTVNNLPFLNKIMTMLRTAGGQNRGKYCTGNGEM